MQNLIVSILALALLLSVGCDDKPSTTEPRLRPVRYVVVDDPVDFHTRTFSGSSKFAQESRLSFKVAGTVVKIPVQVGDKLKRNDLVAQLDSSQYELQVQQAQAALVQTQANARNAQANYERVKGLYENNNVSRNDLDSARATAESAIAQQKASQKTLELARLNLSYTRLTVEADCSIAELVVEVNENVNVGSQVAQVNCGRELEVTIEVPESLIGQISQNMPVDIHFDAAPEKVFKGQVFEVGVSSNSASNTFLVSARLNDPDVALRSGLAAEVSFAFSSQTGHKAYLIPLAAVVNDIENTFVFVADQVEQKGQAQVSRKVVRLGELTEQGVQVLEGLVKGDRVITAGVSVIREGQQVLLP